MLGLSPISGAAISGWCIPIVVPPVVVTDVTDTHDGFYDQQPRRVKGRAWKKKGGEVRQWLIEAYREATEEPAAAPAVAAIVAPFVKPEVKKTDSVTYTAPTVPQIDWIAFAKDLNAVYALIAAVERFEREREEEENETMLLLLSA